MDKFIGQFGQIHLAIVLGELGVIGEPVKHPAPSIALSIYILRKSVSKTSHTSILFEYRDFVFVFRNSLKYGRRF